MKKLTWALLSLMLFLGLGVAFALEDEGDGGGGATTTITVPSPAFTPEDNATVEQGQAIVFDCPEDLMDQMVFFCYIFDNEDEALKPVFSSEQEIQMALFGMHSFSYELAVFQGGQSTSHSVIPLDMTPGVHNMRVRTAVAVMAAGAEASDEGAGEGGDADAEPTITMYYSDVVKVTYTVKAATPMHKPVFDPETGDIAYAGPATLSFDEADKASHGDPCYIFYVVDQDDFDFSTYTDDASIKEAGAKMATINANFARVTKSMKVKAAACKYVSEMDENMDMVDKLYAWSEAASVEYTVGKPDDPTFEPAAGTVLPGTKVTLKSTAHNTVKIYYTTDGTAPSVSSTLYTEPFELTASAKVKAIAVGEEETNVSTVTEAEYTVKEATFTFEPVAGPVAFGAHVTVDCDIDGADIHYTTDGTTPTKTSPKLGWADDVLISKATTINVIAVLNGVESTATPAEYTVTAPTPRLALSPMKDDSVGYNMSTGISFLDDTKPTTWLEDFQAEVYYTTDGTTEPSKANYEAQTDKENGAIKKLAVEWKEEDGYYGPVRDVDGNFMSLTFTEATRLKAIGYVLDGETALQTTALLDTMLQVKVGVAPEYNLATGTAINVGGRFVIKNPYFIPDEEPYDDEYGGNDPEDPGYGVDDDESGVATQAARAEGDEEVEAVVYFSFDGTKPTKAAYDAQEADWASDDPYRDYKVFKTKDNKNAEIAFGKDEKGYYAHILTNREVLGFPSSCDTIRLGADKTLNVQAMCVSEVKTGKTTQSMWGGEVEEMMNYGSEFVPATYTAKDPAAVPAPVIKTPAEGSEVETKSEITFEILTTFPWEAYGNLAYVLYVENDDEVKLEGTAEQIANAVVDDPAAPMAKSGSELGYKVVNCFKNGATYQWNPAKSFIETKEGALKIRARLVGIDDNDDAVVYSEEVTVNCTVKKGEDVEPGIDPENPQLPETVKAPTFVPAAGAVEKGQAITWKWDEAYEAFMFNGVAYVVNGEDKDLTDIDVEAFQELWNAYGDEDENTVREEGVVYLYVNDVDQYPYQVKEACTIKACLILAVTKDGEEGEEPVVEIKLSPVVTAAYTIKPSDPVTPDDPEVKVAKPTFDPVAGEVKKGTKVTVSCETEGAVIYYTVDGTEPTDKSTKYEAAIEINEAMTVKAIAIKGDAKSEVAEAAYTVKEVANEDLELAGVSVYPNPSNGLFNIELPVAATVEVFASNGVLVQRLTLGEGNATLNIERSGIYFLRITGEGRTTVKRLIVR